MIETGNKKKGRFYFMTYTWNMPASITLPGGTKREYSYNPLMQIKSFTAKDPGQNQLMTYNYQHSPAGNITAKNTEHGNYAYQYDELYRLKQATNPSSANEAYTYDAIGNRLTSADVQGSWSYNANNELLSYNGVAYEYDSNGIIIRQTDQTGTTTFAYDIDNRLIQIHNPQSEIYNYYYDPFGRRFWKEVNGVKTYFFYSDEGLIGEYNTSGIEIKTYGYAPNSTWTTNPLFQKIGTNYYWYQNDHLGTPQKIIDLSGRTVWSAMYDSFGNIQITVAEIENNLRFPGQYYDAETGLHYNYFRYYNPEIGRYISEDPIGLAGGDINLYSYVGSNPVNRTDPLGLHWIQGPFGPIPHTHAGANGPVTVVNPRDPGAWPGDPQHVGQSSCEKDCSQFLSRCYLLAGIGGATTGIVCNTVCVAGTEGYGVVFCRVVCSGTGASVGGALQVSCYAAYQKCMEKCKCKK
jgi:RHS repeat-associated protein